MPTIINRASNDCSSFTKNPSKGDLRDIKRKREFKPKKIKVLFACESLPSDTNNFFYYKHSILFDNTLKAFQNVFPKITQATFLDRFKALAFYLDDLCGEPVNQLKNTSQEKKKRICLRKLYEPDFAKRLELYNPQFIIITPKEITNNILGIFSRCGINVPYKELSFPAGSQTNVKDYKTGLVAVLKELIEKNVIRPSLKST